MDEVFEHLAERAYGRVAEVVDLAEFRARKESVRAGVPTATSDDAVTVDVPTLDDPAELARFFMAAGAGHSTRQAVQLSHGTRRSVAVAAGAAGAAGAVLRWRPRPS